MFDKSRRSFISGARGTYRVRDSSIDATPPQANPTTNNNTNNIGSTNCPPVLNINPPTSTLSLSSSTYSKYYSRGRNKSAQPPPTPNTNNTNTGKGKKLFVTVIFLDDTQHTFELEVSLELLL